LKPQDDGFVYDAGLPKLTDAEVKEWRAGHRLIVVHLCVRYRDVFSQTERTTQLCLIDTASETNSELSPCLGAPDYLSVK
jgi:hypothetical protein